MMVATFSLDWLEDDCADFIFIVGKGCLDLSEGQFLTTYKIRKIFIGQRKMDHRIADSRPIKLSKPFCFVGLRIGQTHCVSRPSVECLIEMNHFRPPFLTVSFLEILLYLPIHRYLQRILNGKRASGNKKRMGQVIRNSYTTQGL